MGMELFRNYRLVEDSQGFVLEIYLNHDDEEFSAEFLAKIKENALSLEESVKKLIAEKFPNIKINAVKFLIGSMVVGSLALGGLSAHQNMTASAAAPQASAVQMANQKTATVTASQLNVRSGPSTAYSIVHVLRQGDTVEVIGESDGWYQIRLKDGRVGWSSGQYLNLNSQSAARRATVTASQLNVRSGPSTAYSIVHVLRQGETVEVIGESDGWYQIRLKDGRVGWSSGQYLNLNSQSAARRATVTASQLNVRSGPSTAYSIVHVLRQGETVEVIGESDGWYQIRLKDGRVGWSSGQYLNLNSQSVARQAKVDAVLNRAKSFLGTPYVWGGASPSDGGFDCSGFTQYVFAQSGYNLNRVSKDQALNGTYVPRGSTQPGDLVFYSHAQNGVIDHVGIYLGDGKMIHSPKTGDVVRIADVTTDYWTSRYVTTRRIIP